MNHQRTRCHEAGDFCVSEVPQQPEHVPVNRLGGQAFTGAKITPDVSGIDAHIQRRRVKRDEAALTQASYEHG